jgi:hypothetical protein
LHMFDIMSLQQMLRRKSTYHSNYKGIQAGRECNEVQDHIIYCWVITTICTVPRHCIQFGLKSTFGSCNSTLALHCIIIHQPSCAST